MHFITQTQSLPTSRSFPLHSHFNLLPLPPSLLFLTPFSIMFLGPLVWGSIPIWGDLANKPPSKEVIDLADILNMQRLGDRRFICGLERERNVLTGSLENNQAETLEFFFYIILYRGDLANKPPSKRSDRSSGYPWIHFLFWMDQFIIKLHRPSLWNPLSLVLPRIQGVTSQLLQFLFKYKAGLSKSQRPIIIIGYLNLYSNWLILFEFWRKHKVIFNFFSISFILVLMGGLK